MHSESSEMGYSSNSHEPFLHAILEGFTEACGMDLKYEAIDLRSGVSNFILAMFNSIEFGKGST